MINKTIEIYVFIDDLLKLLGHQEDKKRKISDAEVLTRAIISASYFVGHMDHARCVLCRELN